MLPRSVRIEFEVLIKCARIGSQVMLQALGTITEALRTHFGVRREDEAMAPPG